MSESFYNYVHRTLEKISDRIDDFMQNYTPINISIPGTAVFGIENGNVHEQGSVTVHSPSTFNGDVVAGNVQINDLTVVDHTTFNSNVVALDVQINNLTVIDTVTIGQSCEGGGNDHMTVNSITTFNSEVEISSNGGLNVAGNATFGTDGCNRVTVNGTAIANNLKVPLVNDNSLEFGCSKLITYIEKNTDTILWQEYPNSVIVVVKNTSNVGGISIAYGGDCENYRTLGMGQTDTYLKTVVNFYTLIHTTDID